jgi:hypothetical protein
MQKILIVGKHPERFPPPPFFKKKKGEREPVSKRNHKQEATMSKPKSTTPVKID